MLAVREDFRDILLSAGLSQAEIQNIPDDQFEVFVSALLDENSPRMPRRPQPAPLQPRNQYAAPQVANRATLSDGFGNGNMSEEEALRLAIEQSLDDQLIPPHMRPIPEPENEVGYRPTQRRAASNRQDIYRFDQKSYPKYPNPEPTPLPRQITTKRTQIADRQYKPPSSTYESRYQTSTTPKTRTRTNQTTSNPRTTPKTGTRTTAGPKTTTTYNNPQRNVTSSKSKVRNANQYNPTNRFEQRETDVPRSTANFVVTNSTTKTNTTTRTNARKTPVTSNRDTKTPKSTANPRLTPATKEIGYDVVMSKPDAAPHSRNPPKSTNYSTKTSNVSNHNLSTKKSTDRIQSNKVPHQSSHPTFPTEAITDPTLDILHPNNRFNNKNDESLFEWADGLPSKKATSNQQSNVNKPRPPPPPAYEEPIYIPEVQPPPPKPAPKAQPSLSDSQKLRNLQNMEFIMAEQEAERKQREEMEQKAAIERQLEQEKRNKENKLKNTKSLYEKLPAEPPNDKGVVTVKVQIPDGQGIVRRFLPDRPGNDIYIWVSGNTLDLPEEKRLYPDSFELNVTFNEVLDKNKSLAEQNIKGRIFLSISEL